MTTLDRDRATAPVLPEAGSAWPITTTESAKLFARASVVSPGGVQGEGRGATPYPLFMTRAQGSRIWDVDGNEFIDFHSSFGAVLLGHNDPRIKAAVVRAMDEHGVSFSAANPLEVELAERLIGMIPSAERVVFSCTGHRGDLSRDPPGARLHGSGADPQVRGQLPRLARLRRLEPPLRDGRGRRRAHAHRGIGRDPGRRARPRRGPRVQRRGRRPRAARPRGRHDRGRDRRAGLPQRGRRPARAGLPRGAARGLHRGGQPAHLRRGDHRLPARSRRGAGPLRRHARPDDHGQGARQRVPDLAARRTGRGHGPPRAQGRRAVRRHVRGPGPGLRGRARGLADRAGGCDPRATCSRLEDRLIAGIQAAIDETGTKVQVHAIAGVWTIYFTDEPIRRFRDFARFAMDKDHPIQRGYRNWLLERGIYIHPHYMIRGFLTGAHTEADVDRVVDATASFLRAYASLLGGTAGRLRRLRRAAGQAGRPAATLSRRSAAGTRG